MKNSILFFGELSPNIVHGISLSNSLNINLLSQKFDIKIIEEINNLDEHTKRSSIKFKKIISYIRDIFMYNIKNQYQFFYTIFSLSTFGSIKTLASLFVFRISGKGEIILHIHRGDFETFYHKNILNKFFSKIIFKITNKLIVLSDNQKKNFTKYFKSNNIFVLENSLLAEYTFKKNNIYSKQFLYISNYIKEKGIFELLETFKSIDNKQLQCFGGFVNNEDEIRKYESDIININGFINGQHKFEIINKSDALILPSWNEGQPTIILEAMMMGTIILTTKVGLIVELLGEEYPFYFKINNILDLQRCIDKFINYEKKAELSQKIKSIYWEKYSKKIHEDKLLKIFGNINE